MDFFRAKIALERLGEILEYLPEDYILCSQCQRNLCIRRSPSDTKPSDEWLMMLPNNVDRCVVIRKTVEINIQRMSMQGRLDLLDDVRRKYREIRDEDPDYNPY